MTNRLAVLAARILTATVLVAAISVHAQTAPVWKQYSYPSDGFAISAPSEPAHNNQTKATESGNVEIHTYAITLNANSVVMISSSEVVGLEKDSPRARLQKAKEGALQAGNATLTSEKEIMLGLYTGLQYEAMSQNLHVRARMYIVKNTLFQLLEICPLNTPFSADAERISSSFKVIPRQ